MNKIQTRKQLPEKKIIERYVSGESCNSIAKSFGVSRHAINNRLHNNNINIRRQIEANQLFSSSLSREEHKKKTLSANIALRGTNNTNEHRCKIAEYYELHPEMRQSRYEREMQNYLEESKIKFKPQKAFSRYNTDFAFEDRRIVLEIFGGVWHGSGRHVNAFNKKSDLLFSHGWIIVVAWCRGGVDPKAIYEYISGIDNKIPRHYVISGYAKPCKIGKKKLNYIPSLL